MQEPFPPHMRHVPSSHSPARPANSISPPGPLPPHPHPQVIARIHTNSYPVRRLIHSLLVRIGRFHPQALMYPLLVACKSQSVARRAAAVSVMDNVRQHSATLVEQAQLVSQELIRMAVLWHEQWHESLEEASRCVGVCWRGWLGGG